MAGAPRSGRLRILCVGGLDPCGGAGVTADARMAAALGAEAATVATSLTLQNRHGFRGQRPVDPGFLQESLAAVAADGPVAGLKFGLMPGALQLEACVTAAREHFADLPWIVDPVFAATAAGLDADAELVEAYAACMPWVDVLTPNQSELIRLGGDPGALLARGCQGVLVTGGDQAGEVVVDRLEQDSGGLEIRHPRIACGPVHGTGCALATAICVGRARGLAREEACQRAVGVLAQCLQITEPQRDGLAVPLQLADLAAF